MRAMSIERDTTFQAVEVAVLLQAELLRDLTQYSLSVDALGLEQALDDETARDDLAHLCETQRLARMLHDHLRNPSSRSTSTCEPASLTRREIEVLERVAEGLCTADVATSLHISRNTVRNHIQNILGKLSVHTRLQAVTHALRCGLIQPSPGPDHAHAAWIDAEPAVDVIATGSRGRGR